MTLRSRVALIATPILALTLLAGCTPSSGDGTANQSPSAAPSVTPTFSPNGTASDNIAMFRFVISRALHQAGWEAKTSAVAQQLVAAGFAKKGIQFTPNSTAIGLKPDSVTVSAVVGKECLIAQYGPSIKDLAVSVAPVLSSGGCLLGRSIEHL